MTDATHIEPQKMIAAARKMQDRSFSMSTEQDHLQTNIQPAQVFGSALGQNGIPGEFFLRKVASLEHAWDPTGDWRGSQPFTAPKRLSRLRRIHHGCQD